MTPSSDAIEEAKAHGRTQAKLEYAQRALQSIYEATRPGKRPKPSYVIHALARTGLELSDEGFRLSARDEEAARKQRTAIR